MTRACSYCAFAARRRFFILSFERLSGSCFLPLARSKWSRSRARFRATSRAYPIHARSPRPRLSQLALGTELTVSVLRTWPPALLASVPGSTSVEPHRIGHKSLCERGHAKALGLYRMALESHRRKRRTALR